MKNFLWEGVHRIVLTLEDLDKPVIAAVNGAAMGAGMDMAIMCDLRVCSERARLAESYIMMGLGPGDGGSYFLPRLVGTSKALELIWTVAVLIAKEALKLGLVYRVVSSMTSVMDETICLANIAASPLGQAKRADSKRKAGPLRLYRDPVGELWKAVRYLKGSPSCRKGHRPDSGSSRGLKV